MGGLEMGGLVDARAPASLRPAAADGWCKKHRASSSSTVAGACRLIAMNKSGSNAL